MNISAYAPRLTTSMVSSGSATAAANDGDGLTGAAALNDGDAAAHAAARTVVQATQPSAAGAASTPVRPGSVDVKA